MKNRKSETTTTRTITTTTTTIRGENVQRSSAKMTTLSKVSNVLVQLILVVITGFIIFRTVKAVGIVLYTFHPALVSIGYLILTSHAILAMADKNVFTQGKSYQQRLTTHWVLQATALVLITAGQSAIYVNKDLNGWPHYQSIHSLFGLTTYLLTVIATLGGVLTKYSFKLSGFVKPNMLKAGHGFAGILVYGLAMVTIVLGINQTLTDESDFNVKLVILLTLVVTAIYIVSKSFKVSLQRLTNKTKQ